MKAKEGLLLLLFVLAFVHIHYAKIIVSGTTDYEIGTGGESCSLRGAIINANERAQIDPNCASGTQDVTQEIVIQATGTYTLDIPAGIDDDAGYIGDLDILVPINISSPQNFVIDGANMYRIMDIHDFTFVTLTNLTFTNGYDISGSNDRRVCGGIRCSSNTTMLTLNNVVLKDNIADLSIYASNTIASAGILYGGGGPLFMDTVSFQNNHVVGQVASASVAAGCLIAESFYTVTHNFQNVEMLNNQVDDFIPFDNSTFASGCLMIFGASNTVTLSGYGQNNKGYHGGVLFSYASQLEFDLTNDLSNNVGILGGAIYFSGNSSHIKNTAEINCRNHSILSNHADYGGVVFTKSLISVRQCGAISNNYALQSGGAFYSENNHVSVDKVDEILNNTASNAGGFGYGTNSNWTVSTIGKVINNTALNGGLIYNDGDANTYNFVYLTKIAEISYNNASQRYSLGGVVVGINSDVGIANVLSIHHNKAYKGGVIYSENPPNLCIIANITGSIYNNTAYAQDGAGSLIYVSGGNATIFDVTGDITYNEAPDGDGGLIYTLNGNGTMFNIKGNISNQFAINGGLIRSEGVNTQARIHNCDVDIHDNIALYNGGILSCEQTCIFDINQGEIYNNLCGRGCLLFSDSQTAILESHIGNIYNNSAFYSGGVIDAPSIVVTDVLGEIKENLAQRDSGGAFYSENGTISITKVKSISGNIAKINGGGMYAQNDITITNVCTIDNNDAQVGEGGACFSVGGAVTVIGYTSLNGNTPNNISAASTTYTSLPPLTVDLIFSSFTNNYYVVDVQSNLATTYLWSNGDTTQSTHINTPSFSVIATSDSYCQLEVTYTIPSPVVDAGEDTLVCPNEIFPLGGNPTATVGPPSGGPASYLWKPLNSTFNPKTPNPSGRIYDTTEFTVTVTDTAVGLATTDTVTMKIASLTANAGGNVYVCRGESVVIGGSPAATVTDGLSLAYYWSPETYLNSRREANPVVTPSFSQDYALTVTTYECPDLVAQDFVSVQVLDISIPTAVASPNGAESVMICLGGSTLIGGVSNGEPGPLTYEWTPETGLSNTTSAQTLASPTTTTTYTLKVSTFGGCGSDTDSFTVIVDDIKASAGNDFYNSGQLGGSPTATGGIAPYTYNWSPTTGIVGASNVASPFCEPTHSTTYVVTVRDKFGCIQVDTVNVIVQNPDTMGDIYVTYAFNTSKRTVQPEDALQVLFSDILGVPLLVVGMAYNLDSLDNTTSYVNIYEFGVSGNELLVNLLTFFGCDINDLPCTVSTSLISQFHLSTLVFTADLRAPGVYQSFSDLNDLSTMTSFLSTRTSTTYTVSKSTQTTFLTFHSQYDYYYTPTTAYTSITSNPQSSNYSSSASTLFPASIVITTLLLLLCLFM